MRIPVKLSLIAVLAVPLLASAALAHDDHSGRWLGDGRLSTEPRRDYLMSSSGSTRTHPARVRPAIGSTVIATIQTETDDLDPSPGRTLGSTSPSRATTAPYEPTICRPIQPVFFRSAAQTQPPATTATRAGFRNRISICAYRAFPRSRQRRACPHGAHRFRA